MMIDFTGLYTYLIAFGPPVIAFFLGGAWAYSKAVRNEGNFFEITVAIIGCGFVFGLLGLGVSFILGFTLGSNYVIP